MVKSVAASAGHISEVCGGRSYASDSISGVLKMDEAVHEPVGLVQRRVGESDGDQRVFEFVGRRNPDALPVQIGVRSAPGVKQFVPGHFVNHARRQLVFVHQRDADAIRREIVHEIGRAVQRIDDPFERLSFDGGGHGTFFGDESCVGSQFAKPFDDHLFGLLVDI